LGISGKNSELFPLAISCRSLPVEILILQLFLQAKCEKEYAVAMEIGYVHDIFGKESLQ
jgi:hypothetical protein